jgi:hypothetical protein
MSLPAIFLLSSLLMAAPESSSDTAANGIQMDLDLPPVSSASSPNAPALNFQQVTGTEEQQPAETSGFLDSAEKERKRLKEQLEYEQTVASIAQKKAETDHKQNVETQSKAFSKEFLALDILAVDFKTRFEEIFIKYPLAAEDEFCAKLMDKGRRVVASREHAKPSPAQSKQPSED